MSTIPLQFVLLIAVATSHIFGGVSCCCLGRTLFADLLTVSNTTATELALQKEFSWVRQKQQTGKCQKCLARKSSPTATEKIASNRLHDHRAKVCQDGECRCVKLAVKASSPPLLSHDSHAWVSLALGVNPEREVLTHILANYDVPIRFGGRSWQSIACVWKN